LQIALPRGSKQKIHNILFQQAITLKPFRKEPYMKNIIETAVENGSFPTLVAALKAADLVGTLSGTGPFTVFAPSEEAFKSLPTGTLDMLLKPENKAKLASVLKYHVVSGKANAAAVTEQKEWKTLEGSNAKITANEGSRIEQAKITKTDIECTNGFIHVIDAVIMPPSMQDKKAA
jgi:transforming growth factor-beta-induced protein